MNEEDLVTRLRKRASIRRTISTRKSFQQGKPDRLSLLLEEAADRIEILEKRLVGYEISNFWKITTTNIDNGYV